MTISGFALGPFWVRLVDVTPTLCTQHIDNKLVNNFSFGFVSEFQRGFS